MRMQRSVLVDADPHLVWKHVSNPDCYPEFMDSLVRWETVTDGDAAIGSRYTVHWLVGSVPIGGVIEVSEFDEARDVAWIGITGVTLRGRFRIRERHDGRTKVEFRMAYEAPGGVLGLVADWVAARQVGRIMEKTLVRLKSLIEA